MHPFEKFSERFNDVRSRKGRSGWLDVIIAILPAIIPIIQDCFNASPKAVRRRFLNRSRLALGIMRNQPGMKFAEAFEAADDCFDVADAATDAEIQEFMECCK